MWLAVLATLLAYLPVAGNQFVEWDDSNHIFGNPHIRSLDLASIKWMFTHFYVGNWIPLTWLSLALDFRVGRLEPWVYHLDNLVLHLLNTALVFGIGRRLMQSILKSGKGEGEQGPILVAFGTALFFGLHPLHVESVAWAAERKDVLCGLFYLASLRVYLEHALKPRPWKIGLCLGLFLVALMSKPMAISLPFVFLLLDYWPLGRLSKWPKRTLLEKIPFLMVVLGQAWITVTSQFEFKAEVSLKDYPLLPRLMNAAHSAVFYLYHLVFPEGLAAYYPIRLQEVYSLPYILSVVLVLGLSTLCYLYRKKIPYLAVTWFFYLVTLAPVMGILQVGHQGAADRFAYLPSLGPLLLAAALLVRLFSGKRKVLIGLALGGTVLLGGLTWRQVSFWKDTAALWKHVLLCYPNNNYVANHNLGEVFEKEGRLDDALAQYSIVIALDPYIVNAYYGKARIYATQGFLDDSIAEYKVALQVNPKHPPLYSALALVYQKKGMEKEAIEEAQEALRVDPNYAESYANLGRIYREQGKNLDSLGAYQEAWDLEPENADYFRGLLAACQRAGRPEEALKLYRMLSANPRSVLAMAF
jgi:tetratricopeptide (TPR) repeat protein